MDECAFMDGRCRFKGKSKEEKEMIMTNRECYTRMHNYTLFVGSDIEVEQGNWAKVVHTRRILRHSRMDWLFFADVDFFITQFDRPLESFIVNDGMMFLLSIC